MVQLEHTSWLPVPDEHEVPKDVQTLWRGAFEKFGFVPNVLQAYGLRPNLLLGWVPFYDEAVRGESGLTPTQREMIALVVSTENRCHYCMVVHSAALRVLTGDPILVEALATNGSYASVEGNERAMLDFAIKLSLTRDPSQMRADDIVVLRDAGWTDEDIFDIAQVASVFALTNRMASALGLKPNPEYFDLAR